MSDVTAQGKHETAEVDFVALPRGQTIGRYEIVSILGQGGFGITYRARDAQLDREVAIKEYLPMALAVRQDGTTVLPRSTKLAEDFNWGRDRFVSEGRTLASLQRAPAIVRVFDFLQVNGTAYIVMELLAGETLEARLKRQGTLAPADIDRLLWPLLEGLEQVHETGFLHRDIKPANILLDAVGNPTLIDFGASRAAMAGRTTAMTAIFTPGYAAAEQFTSAKQGPWTDIYGLSATLYHAITGAPPPSAFDRMLDDTYEPLAKRLPAGFAPGLLVGIDAGLAVRASDRPQSISGWRSILQQVGSPDMQATVALGRTADPGATVMMRPALPPEPPPTAKRGAGLWVGAAVLALALGAAGYYIATRPATVDPTAAESAQKARDRLAAAEAAARQAEADAATLRAEKEERERLEREAAQRRQIEEETRRKIEAELAAKQQAEEEARRTAEQDEAALKLTTGDRQRAQVALSALGFPTGSTDGVFGPHTREMIGAWQKSHDAAPTGFLTGAQNQALLRDAAPALAKFEDDQRKASEPAAKPPPAPSSAPRAAAVAPPAPSPSASAAASVPGASVPTDGLWQGTYACEAGAAAGGGTGDPFTLPVRIGISGGAGTWLNRSGNRTLSVQVNGSSVVFTRMIGAGQGQGSPVTLAGQLSGTTMTASGHETPFGRRCAVSLTRISDIGAVPAATAGSSPTGGTTGSAGSGGNRGGHRQR